MCPDLIVCIGTCANACLGAGVELDSRAKLVFHSGFNTGEDTCDAGTLFEHLCEWDEKGYIMCADTCRPGGNKDTHKTDGVVDGHVSDAYVPACVRSCARG